MYHTEKVHEVQWKYGIREENIENLEVYRNKIMEVKDPREIKDFRLKSKVQKVKEVLQWQRIDDWN